MLSRTHLIAVLFFWMLLACNLSGSVNPTFTPQAITPPPTATDFDVPTQTPTNTPQPTATNRSPVQQVPTAILPHVCNPRLDWQNIYSVNAGDTLGKIAGRVNSSVEELTIANCLANPNQLMVGQNLRVPRLPQATATAPIPTPYDRTLRILSFVRTSSYPPMLEWRTENAEKVLIYLSDSNGENRLLGTYDPNSSIPAPTTAGVATFRLTMRDVYGNDVIGSNGLPVYAIAQVSGGDPQGEPECPVASEGGAGTIDVAPLDASWSSCQFVKGGNQSITLSWTNMPSNIFSIEYWFMPTSGDCSVAVHGNPNVIATDMNLSDGVNPTWQVGLQSCAGLLYAYGYGEGTSVDSALRPLVIR